MTLTTPPSAPNRREPAWEIARLFPNQGEWTEGDYLTLNRWTNRPVELADGQVEVLEMPTRTHQRLVLRVRDEFRSLCEPKGLGEALVAPYPVRLREGKFREPDVVFMLMEHADRLREDFADGADLVVDVVSEDRSRDLVTKRTEYAGAGIAEYLDRGPARTAGNGAAIVRRSLCHARRMGAGGTRGVCSAARLRPQRGSHIRSGWGSVKPADYLDGFRPAT
jgi:Uma2 family endonuclease